MCLTCPITPAPPNKKNTMTSVFLPVLGLVPESGVQERPCSYWIESPKLALASISPPHTHTVFWNEVTCFQLHRDWKDIYRSNVSSLLCKATQRYQQFMIWQCTHHASLVSYLSHGVRLSLHFGSRHWDEMGMWKLNKSPSYCPTSFKFWSCSVLGFSPLCIESL